MISAGGIPVAALGSLHDITVPLPALPLGMTIQRVSVTGQGVLVHMAGQNVSFGPRNRTAKPPSGMLAADRETSPVR